MFVEMVEAQAINFPPQKPEGINCDRNKYCPYHRRHGHNLDDCWVFKDIVNDWVEEDKIEWDALIDKVRRHHQA